VLIIPSSWGFPTSFLVSTTHQQNSNHKAFARDSTVAPKGVAKHAFSKLTSTSTTGDLHRASPHAPMAGITTSGQPKRRPPPPCPGPPPRRPRPCRKQQAQCQRAVHGSLQRPLLPPAPSHPGRRRGSPGTPPAERVWGPSPARTTGTAQSSGQIWADHDPPLLVKTTTGPPPPDLRRRSTSAGDHRRCPGPPPRHPCADEPADDAPSHLDLPPMPLDNGKRPLPPSAAGPSTATARAGGSGGDGGEVGERLPPALGSPPVSPGCDTGVGIFWSSLFRGFDLGQRASQ
jgi:hypothetical protein